MDQISMTAKIYGLDVGERHDWLILKIFCRSVCLVMEQSGNSSYTFYTVTKFDRITMTCDNLIVGGNVKLIKCKFHILKTQTLLYQDNCQPWSINVLTQYHTSETFTNKNHCL